MSSEGTRTITQRIRTTVLPHRFQSGGLDFDLQGCEVDQGEVTVESTAREVLVTPDSDWESATLTGTLELPEAVVEDVFPSDEHGHPPGQLFVALRCRETILRDRSVVKRSPTEPGEYPVTISLPRERLRGTVEIQPYLVRAAERPGDLSNYATDRGSRLASGIPWTMEIDEPEHLEGFLDRPIVERFSEHDGLPSADHLHYLDMSDAERPRLYLNADHQTVVNVTMSEASTGPEARMRNVVFDLIEQSVWPQLIVRTASDIDESGEPTYEWQYDVLDLFHDTLYEDTGPREAALNLRDDVESKDGIATLMERIDDAVQQRVKPPQQLMHLVEEGLTI